MYYQLRRGSRQNKIPIRISFKRYSKIWRLINASLMKTINFAISFPIIVLLFLIIPITLVFKWIVSLAHRIVCLGGTYQYNAIDFKLSSTSNYNNKLRTNQLYQISTRVGNRIYIFYLIIFFYTYFALFQKYLIFVLMVYIF